MVQNLFNDIEYRRQIIHALLQRINQHAITDRFQLEAILYRTHWDLDRAEIEFRGLAQQARDRHVTATPGRDALQMDDDALLGSSSIHESHRRAVNMVFRRLGAHLPSFTGTPLSFLRIAEVLRRNAWVVNEAIRHINQQAVNPGLEEQVALAERRLRLHTTTRYNEDRRVQVLLEITGTDDDVSARAMLERHGYDLAVVVDSWMERGLPVALPTRQLANSRTYQAPTRDHNKSDDLSLGGVARVGPVSGTTSADLAEANTEYNHLDKTSRKGWPIRYDPVPAHVGMPNPTKFFAEAIRMGKATKTGDGTYAYGQGKYTRYEMEGVREEGTGRKGKDGREVGGKMNPFDWFNPSDVSLLNKHYRQPFRRLEPAAARNQVNQRYTPEELAWVEARLEENMRENQAANPQYGDPHVQRPVPIDFDRLTARFNAEFERRTDLTIDGQPRPRRMASGLSSMVHRTKQWCNKYALKYFPAHKPKPPPGSVSKAEEENEIDSGGAPSDETDEDGGPGNDDGEASA